MTASKISEILSVVKISPVVVLCCDVGVFCFEGNRFCKVSKVDWTIANTETSTISYFQYFKYNLELVST